MKTATEVLTAVLDAQLKAEAEKAYPGLEAAFHTYSDRFLSSDCPDDRLRAIRYGYLPDMVKSLWIESYMNRNRESFYRRIVTGAMSANEAKENAYQQFD